MKKRSFPKDLKFGTYLPRGLGKRYYKLSDSSAALERFICEYFEGYATVSSTVKDGAADAIYINGEHTAYLFRNIMSALYKDGVIDINITSTERDFMISFSSHSGRIEINDIDLYKRLLDSAEMSGFDISVIGNTLTLSVKLEHGKIVISAITKESFMQILEKVFFH